MELVLAEICEKHEDEVPDNESFGDMGDGLEVNRGVFSIPSMTASARKSKLN